VDETTRVKKWNTKRVLAAVILFLLYDIFNKNRLLVSLTDGTAAEGFWVTAHRKTKVHKRFFKRLCGSTKNHFFI